MAVLSSGSVTLADYAKGMGPDNKLAPVVELLSQANGIIDDLMLKEANGASYHQTSQRTSLPTSSWRNYNEGSTPSKSTKAQVVESMGMLDAWSEVDCKLADLSGDVKAFRASEAVAHIQGMEIEVASTLFYGNKGTAPEEFDGLATRYNSLSGNVGDQVISGSGAGADNSSVWLVVWGDEGVHGIYPRGSSSAGLGRMDYGKQVIETAGATAGGKRLAVYQEQFTWDLGLAIKNPYQVCRIANIDISNLVAKSSAADLIELMIKATYVVKDLSKGKPVFYMNRTVEQMLDIQRYDNVAAAGMTYDMVDGKRVMSFRGIPIKRCDALLESEATIS